MRAIYLVLIAMLASANARPLESYKRYIFLMIHGIGAGPNPKFEEYAPERDQTRKSAIFDRSIDDNVPLTYPADNWMGNIANTLMEDGLMGHVAFYDFYHPWESPVYKIDGANNNGLSQDLGRRTTDAGIPWRGNEMGKDHDGKRYGITPANYWLREYYKNLYKDDYKNEYTDKCAMEQAQDDFRAFYKLKNQNPDLPPPEAEVPKKYILFTHSMGGLTARDYITGSFYKGDVDKLITFDTPHEGSAIANYVNIWNNANLSEIVVGNTVAVDFLLIATPVLSQKFSSTMSLLQRQSAIWNEVALCAFALGRPIAAAMLDQSLQGYGKLPLAGGAPGINAMALADPSTHQMSPILQELSDRATIQDPNSNGYRVPRFSVAWTANVPTPGGPGAHDAMPYLGPLGLFTSTSLVDEGSVSDKIFRIFIATMAHSLWNDEGSGFVPTWSSRGDRVKIMQNPQAVTERIKVAYEPEFKTAAYGYTYTVFAANAILMEKALFGLPYDNFLFRLGRFVGYSGYLAYIGYQISPDQRKDAARYVGYHGRVFYDADNRRAEDAPGDGVGKDKKILDQLIWVKPSLSIPIDQLDVQDKTKGGYIPLSSENEILDVTSSTATWIPVKYRGRSASESWEMKTLTVGETRDEFTRVNTLFITGLKQGTRILGAQLTDGSGNNLGAAIPASDFQLNGGFVLENGYFHCPAKDNVGSAKYVLPIAANGRFGLKLNVSHPSGSGSIYVQIGRAAGKLFVPGGALTPAEDIDFDTFITLKNRRPQKKADGSIDLTVADMLDYYRTGLITVNNIPRRMEFVVDELQPDRLASIVVNFNFGTAFLRFTAQKDPNTYKANAQGFFDHAAEKFEVRITGPGVEKTVVINNPVNPWGKFVIDLDAISQLAGKDVQPFLEGRNHLQFTVTNRWNMSNTQRMNMFIPGPPPAFTPLFPKPGDIVRGAAPLSFETDLLYNVVDELVSSQVTIRYSRIGSNDSPIPITAFTIQKLSNSKYRVTTNAPVDWPAGETGLQIVVTPSITGLPISPLTYNYEIERDGAAPEISLVPGENPPFNPSVFRFSVLDRTAPGGIRHVQDLWADILDASGAVVRTISEERISAAGAKSLDWDLRKSDGTALPTGSYLLRIRAHDASLKDDASAGKRQELWDSYPDADRTTEFAAYCTGAACMTNWSQAEFPFTIDALAPSIGALTVSHSVYAKGDRTASLAVNVTASDNLAQTSADGIATRLEYRKKDADGNWLPPFSRDMQIVSSSGMTRNFTDVLMNPASPGTDAREFPDGIYQISAIAQDQGGNSANSRTIPLVKTLSIDLTAPRIVNAAVPYTPGALHALSFYVNESEDDPALRDADPASPSYTVEVEGRCDEGGTLVYARQADTKVHEQWGKRFTYSASIPANLTGLCKLLIKATDTRGNVGTSENNFVLRLLAPAITSPLSNPPSIASISGKVTIRGHADDPSINSFPDFLSYQLEWSLLDGNGNPTGGWLTTGLTVPDAFASGSEKNVSRVAVSGNGNDDVLGYWNTSLLAVRNAAYRLRVVASDGNAEKSAYSDVMVMDGSGIAPQIHFLSTTSVSHDFNSGKLNVGWSADVPGSDTYRVRLEATQITAAGEKIFTPFSSIIDGLASAAFVGPPSAGTTRRVSLWLENSLVNGHRLYHVRLTAGDKATTFNLSFQGGDGKIYPFAADGTTAASPEILVVDAPSANGAMAQALSLEKTVATGTAFEFTFYSTSTSGLTLSTQSSTLKYPGGIWDTPAVPGGVENIPLHVEGDALHHYLYVGSSSTTFMNGLVTLPNVGNGPNFLWDGKGNIGQDVPTGKYRLRVSLEGLASGATASDEKVIDLTNRTIQITEVRLTPEDAFNFSFLGGGSTLSFNVNQDALVSVIVRAKGGVAPTDLNETMSLAIDGSPQRLDKLLLPGRSMAWNVNWDGKWGGSRQIAPNIGGYEFEIKAYDPTTGQLAAVATKGFQVKSGSMEPDPLSSLDVDGPSNGTILQGGLQYQKAGGLSDYLVHAEPDGSDVATQDIVFRMKYSGHQEATQFPYERYSVGVQLHKRKLEMYAVFAVSSRRKHWDCNWLNYCTSSTDPIRSTGIQLVTFTDTETAMKTVSASIPRWDAGSSLDPDYNFWNGETADMDVWFVPKATFDAAAIQINHKTYTGEAVRQKLQEGSCFNCLEWVNEASVQAFLFSNHQVSGGALPPMSQDGGLLPSWDENTQSGKTFLPPNVSTSNPIWDRACDLGAGATQCDLAAAKLAVPNPALQPGQPGYGAGNGVADKGEPTLNGVPFNPDKHVGDFTVKAKVWKNAWHDGSYIHDGMQGWGSFQVDLQVTPEKRMWDALSGPNVIANWNSYGWNNLVNKYTTLDPLNPFVFGEHGKLPTPIFLRPGKFATFELVKEGRIPFFNRYYPAPADLLNGGFPDDAYAILDQQIAIRPFDFSPDASIYRENPFKISLDYGFRNRYNELKTGSESYFRTPASDVSPIVINPRDLIQKFNFPDFWLTSLKVTISMEDKVGNPRVPNNVSLPWPISFSAIDALNRADAGCGAVCGDNATDKEWVVNADGTGNLSNIHMDPAGSAGSGNFLIHGTMQPMGSDYGFSVSPYLAGTGGFLNRVQGPAGSTLTLYPTGFNVTVTAGQPELGSEYSYNAASKLISFAGGNGAKPYHPGNDPLLSLDDDGDGRADEDGTGGGDEDLDLAVDEDPNGAFMGRVAPAFPFTGSAPSVKNTVRLSSLLCASATEQGIVGDPQSLLANAGGQCLDNARINSRWEPSGTGLNRTYLLYKDGTPNRDLRISAFRNLTNPDATQGELDVAPESFTKQARRLLRIKGYVSLPVPGDNYEIYISSETGWEKLTNTRVPPAGGGRILGTLAYWEVKTSGYHTLVLVRHSEGRSFYTLKNVAIGESNETPNQAFSDPLGRVSYIPSAQGGIVDVVPLAVGEAPISQRVENAMGPVVRIYPPNTVASGQSATVRLRYSREEVRAHGWTDNAGIFAVTMDGRLQRLTAVTWAFYDASGNPINTSLSANDWAYTVLSGSLGGGTGASLPQPIVLAPGQSAPITLADGSHTLSADGISGNSAEITLHSMPQTKRMQVGETALFDADGDGVPDLRVQLLSLAGSTAQLSYENLQVGSASPSVAAFFAEQLASSEAQAIQLDPVPTHRGNQYVLLSGYAKPGSDLHLFLGSSPDKALAIEQEVDFARDGGRFTVYGNLNAGLNYVFVAYDAGVIGLMGTASIFYEADALPAPTLTVSPEGTFRSGIVPLKVQADRDVTIRIFEAVDGAVTNKIAIEVAAGVEQRIDFELSRVDHARSGFRTLTAIAEDKAGLLSEPVVITLPIDDQPPLPEFTGFPAKRIFLGPNGLAGTLSGKVTDNTSIGWMWMDLKDPVTGTRMASGTSTMREAYTPRMDFQLSNGGPERIRLSAVSPSSMPLGDLDLELASLKSGKTYRFTIGFTDISGNASSKDFDIVLSRDNGQVGLKSRAFVFSNEQSSALEDFPVLLRLRQDPDVFDFNSSTSGNDVFFTDAAGERLDFRTETWDGAKGEAAFWIRIPHVPAKGKVPLKLNWGQGAVVTTASPFDVDYSGIWHWDAGLPMIDESGTHDPILGAGPTLEDGVISGASGFDAATPHVLSGSAAGDPSAALTASAWVYLPDQTSIPAAGSLILGTATATGGGWAITLKGKKVEFKVGTQVLSADFDQISDGAWNHIACTYQSSINQGARVYVNGRLAAFGDLNNREAIPASTSGLAFGSDPAGQADAFNGRLDEVRISGSARSADWIRAEYETQKPFSKAVLPSIEAVTEPEYLRWFKINTSASGLNIRQSMKDFPVKFEITSAIYPYFSYNPSPSSIAFADEKGNYLPFDVESWEPNDGKAVVWVRLPELAPNTVDNLFAFLYSADRVLGLNYPQGTWETSHLGVWHGNRDNLSLDASGQGQDGVLQGMASAPGNAGFGVAPSAQSNKFEIPPYPAGLNPMDALSLECWFNLANVGEINGDQANLISKPGNGVIPAYSLSLDKVKKSIVFNVNGSVIESPVNAIVFGAWQHVTATYASGTLGMGRIYLNGSPIQSGPMNAGKWIPANALPAVLGGTTFRGVLDEARVNGKALSGDQVLLNYLTQKQGSSAVSVEQEIPFSRNLFIPVSGSMLEVYAKDNAAYDPSGTEFQIKIVNHAPVALDGMTMRLWLSREENPEANLAVDAYKLSPCGFSVRTSVHPDNANLLIVDVIFPQGYILPSGQETLEEGIKLGLHFRNPASASWNKANDWSWEGMAPWFSSTRKITVYDKAGSLIYGEEPDPFSISKPVSVPVAAASRVTRSLQALYFFHEGAGNSTTDFSEAGVPLDMAFVGNGAKWIRTGGVAFDTTDHNSILENRTGNLKLFESSTQSGEMSVEAWIAPSDLAQTSARILDFAPGDGTLERNWSLSQMGKNIEFRLRTSSGLSVGLTTSSSPLTTPRVPYHIVLTYKPYNAIAHTGGMRIYVNGILTASNQECGTLNASGANAWNKAFILAAGNRPALLDRDWHGSLFVAAVYAAALTDAEAAQNRNALIREPESPIRLFAGVACGDRLVASDIVDGPSPWVEDLAASGASLKMQGSVYAKGLGGKAAANGGTSFLEYDLDSERNRLGLAGNALRVTGFTGAQDGGVAVNTAIKISSSLRKPTDQDWLDNTGSVAQLFTSNGLNNVPVDLSIAGAKWLWMGQVSNDAVNAGLGDFASLRVHFGDPITGSPSSEYQAGLEYRYFHGVWDYLPNFATAIPVEKGTVANFDLSPRLREDNFGFEFSGFIRISTAGTFTFYTTSDDGSQLLIDNQKVVDNDGAHVERECSGTIFLSPGYHAIKVVYFEKQGDQVLKVSYQGPGTPKTAIPASVLVRPGPGSTAVSSRIESGLEALYLFRKESASIAYDLSAKGIPLDLNLVGTGASWVEGGGIAFQAGNHNTILENRTPNQKLYSASTRTGELAVEAWLETSNIGSSDFKKVMQLSQKDGNGQANFMVSQVGRNLEFALRTSSNASVTMLTQNQPIGTTSARYHVVMTYKPASAGPDGGMRIYVNGVLQASNAENGNISVTGTNAWANNFVFSVGNRPTLLDRDWEGRIFLTAAYDRILTPEQVQVNFRAGIPTQENWTILPLGVTSDERLLPLSLQDGAEPWKEDLAGANQPISMGGTAYRTGLAGKPRPDQSASWMLYDLDRERSELGIAGVPLRLTGFAGGQDATGTVKWTIKTSRMTTPPSLDEWNRNIGGATEKFTSQGVANAPFDIDLDKAKWVWLSQTGTGSGSAAQGVLGQAKIRFGKEAIGNLESGLFYNYFESTTDALPDFESLTPVKSGLLEQVGISQALRSDNFSFEYKGFLQVISQGSYTFYTSSDDGSRLFIDGRLVVDNDGLHGMQERSGAVSLVSGYHAIKIQFFNKSGGKGLDVQYQGPGIAKQALPANVLFHSARYAYGIDSRYYEGHWSSLPDFGVLTPLTSYARSNFRIAPRNRSDDFGFLFEGNVFIPTAGDYTFFLNSDDGSKLYIDGAALVDNDGSHAMQEKGSTISLSAGFHAIRVAFFEATGSEGLETRIQGPGMAKMPIPSEMLFGSTFPTIPTTNPCVGTQCGKASAITMGGENADHNYPISGEQWFRIPVSQYVQPWVQSVYVALDDQNGMPMSGSFNFENAQQQALTGYFQSFPVSYTGQAEIFFTIKVPADRLYKVRWWFQ